MILILFFNTFIDNKKYENYDVFIKININNSNINGRDKFLLFTIVVIYNKNIQFTHSIK